MTPTCIICARTRYMYQLRSQMKTPFPDKDFTQRGDSSDLWGFPYWCFNWPNFTRNAEVANSPIVKLMRVQNWIFSNVPQNWCCPPILPTNAIPAAGSFQENFSPLYLYVYHFLQNEKLSTQKKMCAEICLGVNANLETFLKTKTCSWRKCTRTKDGYVHNICKHCPSEISPVHVW